MNELALFAGAGGGILGGKMLGWRTVCAVEYDEHARNVLVKRQNDGCIEPFPVWDDVRTFDGRPWSGIVDVISGGFPCQDISCAGKGAGIEGERSGLWKEMSRIIGEVRPRYVIVENSPMLTIRGGAVVIGDLTEMGYDCRWGVIGAIDAGAPHKRDRIWIMAYSVCNGRDERRPECKGLEGRTSLVSSSSVGNTDGERCEEFANGIATRPGDTDGKCGRDDVANAKNKGNVRRDGKLGATQEEVREHGRSTEDGCREWWSTEPDVGRVAHGVAFRVDRLKRIGNGQVPSVVKLAWNILSNGI